MPCSRCGGHPKIHRTETRRGYGAAHDQHEYEPMSWPIEAVCGRCRREARLWPFGLICPVCSNVLAMTR